MYVLSFVSFSDDENVREDTYLKMNCSSVEKIEILIAKFFPTSECNCSTTFRVNQQQIEPMCCGESFSETNTLNYVTNQ